MRRAVFVVLLALAGVPAGCGAAGHASRPLNTTKDGLVAPRPPVAVCSLLSAGEVSTVLGVRARVRRSSTFCTYQGTGGHVFRAVVVTPQRVAASPEVAFQSRYGPITTIMGHGYRGQAQNDPPAQSSGGLAQAKAQVVSGGVIARLLVTYHGEGLRGVPQLREVTILARGVGRRLARSR